MIPVLDSDRVALVQGDCLEVLRSLAENSIDAGVTDPPYGLGKEPDPTAMLRHWLAGDDYGQDSRGFMGKAWDSFVPGPRVWREVLRVLKPGGHVLAFFGTRTQDLGVLAMRLAGFEIRDSLVWMYGTGFPKSLNVSKAIDEAAGATRTVVGPNRFAGTNGRANLNTYGVASRPDATAPATPEAVQWEGWGTALKPAHEPIVLARKPLIGTVAANVLAHGTGGLNIDGCRIGMSKDVPWSSSEGRSSNSMGTIGRRPTDAGSMNPNVGRWPANVCLDEEAAALLDAQSGESKSGGGPDQPLVRNTMKFRNTYSPMQGRTVESATYGDSGGASRFFYTAKASRKERDRGCEHMPLKTGGEATDRVDGSIGTENPRAGAGRTGGARNHHPTVKPIALMRWLVRLITPPGGTALDPFTGSGTTGIAALQEGFNFLGVERDAEYCQIAKARLVHALTTKSAA